MSKFKPGDKVVLINVDHYSDIMKQLMGKALVVNSIDTDKCGCEIVCARVPGEEGWFLYSDDLRLVSETQAEPAPEPAPDVPAPERAAPEPAPEAQMPERSKLRTVNWGGCGYLNPYADTSPTEPTDPAPAPAAAQKPLRRGDLVECRGVLWVVFSNGEQSDGDYWIASLTGDPETYYATIDELTRIDSIRKKIKRLKAQMDGGK